MATDPRTVAATNPASGSQHGDPEAMATALARANRSLRMLSTISQRIMRARRADVLMQETCQLAVDVGGYRMAWIGKAEGAPGKQVRPLAVAGSGPEYVQSAQITWADEPSGRGPTGRAIREGRAQIARFILSDPRMAPWRDAALRQGYASSCALPVRVSDRIFGALMVYSERPDGFDEEETRILTELTDDLGFALGALHTREALGLTEDRFRSLIENITDIVAVADADGTIKYVSPAVKAIGGYDPADLVGRSYFELVLPEDRPMTRTRFAALAATPRATGRSEMRFRHRDGSARIMESVVRNLLDVPGVEGLVANMRDVSERKRAEAALARSTRALRALSAGNSMTVRAATEQELLSGMCRAVVEQAGYRLAWVGFAESDSGRTVKPVAWHGHDGGYLQLARIAWADVPQGRGPVGRCIREGGVQVVRDILGDASMAPWHDAARKHGLASCAALPLGDAHGAFGALAIYSGEQDAFEGDEIVLLTEMAEGLAFGITAMRTRVARDEGLRRLEHAMEATVRAVATTVELRDPYTAGHQRRVAMLGGEIARSMGLAADRIQGLTLAASIHDVGKINVPAEILAKPGRLTPIEFSLMKQHAEAGALILKDVELPWPVAEIIRQHHERLDGSGYPSGLKGEAILLESRIVAVADVVEAISAHRPYRAALGLDAALLEIEKHRGRLYDETVVDACLKLFRESGYRLPD